MRHNELTTLLGRVEITTRIAFDISVSVLVVTGYGWERLMQVTKDRKISDARAIFCHECVRAGLSTTEIGDLINRNHSSVSHNTRKYAELYQFYPVFRRMADDVHELVNTETLNAYRHENA